MTQPSSDKQAPAGQYPLTPDGRYLVVRGRLWRAANPGLAREERHYLVDRLMDARRAVAAARRSGEAAALAKPEIRSMPPSSPWASAARSGGPTARRT